MIDPTLVGLKSVFFSLLSPKQILYSNGRTTTDLVIPAPPRLTSRKSQVLCLSVCHAYLLWSLQVWLVNVCGFKLRSAVSDIKEHYLCEVAIWGDGFFIFQQRHSAIIL